jgi:hypothetical protein
MGEATDANRADNFDVAEGQKGRHENTRFAQ